MSLTLMYITNNPAIAEVAQKAGVDRIWIDMEYIGKEERQAGMNTVKSSHTIDDIKKVRPIVTSSELMVRVNPIHNASPYYCSSQEEIEEVIQSGADVVMLPMFRESSEVEKFVEYVNGRAKTILLVETAEAVSNIDEILEVEGIDEIHIGLNDLHLAYNKKFMFELVCDGTVENLCKKFKNKNIKYGFGGIARIGYGMLPAEYVIAEHYRLGSTAAILSRSFCNADKCSNLDDIEKLFSTEIIRIREEEIYVSKMTEVEQLENSKKIKELVKTIVSDM